MNRPHLLLAIVGLAATLVAGCSDPPATPVAAPPSAAASAPASAPEPASPAASEPPSVAATATPAPAPAGPALPNPGLTPGEVFAGVTAAQVCTSGYASSVRNVVHEQYVAVYAEYGVPYPQPPGTYELDHLIPLELGGDNSDRNLWPEPAAPAPGFHQKDQLENYLHDAVCSGTMDLGAAQRGIAANWAALYREYLGA